MELIPSCEVDIIKQLWRAVPDGRRKAGRPEFWCLDFIENDLKSMGVERWRQKAEDRSAWAIMLKEALINLQGPFSNGEHGTW
jgi:hypothetical protein